MLAHLSKLIIIFLCSSAVAQNISDYEGDWEGTLSNPNCFNFDVTVETTENDSLTLRITNGDFSLIHKVLPTKEGNFQVSIDEYTRCQLSFSHQNSTISGFITSGFLMYQIRLKKENTDTYRGSWTPFMIEKLLNNSIFLNVESNEDDNFTMYPFFGDQRFTGTRCDAFSKKGNLISFIDFKTGLHFKSELLDEKQIKLNILLGGQIIASSILHPSEQDWVFGKHLIDHQQNHLPLSLNDGWTTSNLLDAKISSEPLEQMIDSIHSGSLPNTHSVLIAKKGQLVFETYFDGFNEKVLHDQRSASKSVTSTMVGIAIEDGIIESVDQSIYELIPSGYAHTKNAKKENICIKDLLTMSSGLDAVDFGTDRNSIAAEDNYQSTRDWLKTVLEAPMINDPGVQAFYGSANPYLLGICLNQQLKQSLHDYMDERLFAPLGISNYIIQTDNTMQQSYAAGGMYLKPRDMLKFGQLYLDEGIWKGTRIVSKKWVMESFKKHKVLENTRERNEYGYLWWRKTHSVGEKSIESYEARGAGGQYIFVLPKLDAVVVITSQNFNEKFNQPETILESFILPALFK